MIERLMCALLGHRYITQLTFSPTSRKVGCTRCEREWAMNDSVRAFVDWSGEFEELYKFNGQWPQSKEWVGLTEGETVELALSAFALPDFPLEARIQLQNELVIAMNTPDSRMMMFAALIEAKLKDKNGY